MLSFSVERTQQALQYLVDSPYAVRHINKLRVAVDKPRAMPFRAECETLNELLVVGRQSRSAMEKLIEIAEFKRSTRGTYQREFMAKKRERERKVIRIECLIADRTLSLDERVLALNRQYEVWGQERESFLRKRAPTSWKSRNKAISDFWMFRDRELDQKIVTLEQRHEIRRKVPATFWAHPQTVMGQKLVEALSKR